MAARRPIVNPPQARFRPSRLMLPAVVLGGFLAGTGIRWSGGMHWAKWSEVSGFKPGAPGAEADGGGLPESAAGKKETAPFSMERFKATSGLEMHRMLARVLPDADVKLVRALAEDLWSREPMPYSHPVWKAVMSRWAALDPESAAAWGRERDAEAREGSRDEGESRLHDLAFLVFSSRAEKDLEGMFTEAAKSNDRDLRKAVIRILAKSDPLRALPMALSWDGWDCTSDSTGTSGFVLRVLRDAAKQDPEKALAWLRSAGLLEKGDAMGVMARSWAVKDPQACASWLLSLPREQQYWAGYAMASAAEENPAAAAAVLARLPKNTALFQKEMEVAATWAGKNPKEALAWARGYFTDGTQRRTALCRMAGVVMETDVRAAVAIMDEAGWGYSKRQRVGAEFQPLEDTVIFPTQDGKQEDAPSGPDMGESMDYPPMGGLLSRLSREDPAMAVRCFEKLDPALKPKLISKIAPEWFRRQPDEAMRWLSSIPASQVSAGVMASMLGEFDNFSVDRMADWAQKLPAGPFTEALARTAAEGGTSADPAEALAQLPYTDPAVRKAAAEALVQKWAATDPGQALDWITSGNEDRPVAACLPIVEDWAAHDPAAASAWTAALPAGAGREASIQGLVAALSNAEGNPDFPAAFAWSLDLADPALRLKTARSLLRNRGVTSFDNDAELAAVLGRAAGLSESDRAQLRAVLAALPGEIPQESRAPAFSVP